MDARLQVAGETLLLLPDRAAQVLAAPGAFGSYSGMAEVQPWPGDRVWVAAGEVAETTLELRRWGY